MFNYFSHIFDAALLCVVYFTEAEQVVEEVISLGSRNNTTNPVLDVLSGVKLQTH